MSSQVPARRLVRQQDHRRARTPATEAEDVAEAHKTKNGRRPAFAGSAAADITSARPLAWHFVGSPDRIRTGVTALRGRRPRPLDDGAVRGTDRIQLSLRSRDAGEASAVQTTASPPVRPTGCHSGRPASAGVCVTRGCSSRVLPPFRQALINTGTPEMNKRGRETRPRCQLNCWGTRTRT